MSITEQNLIPFPGSREVPCPSCQAILRLYQPDIGQPKRLLGVCLACPTWCFVVFGQSGKVSVKLFPVAEDSDIGD